MGFVVAIFDDEWGVGGEPEFASERGLNGAGTGDDDGALWDMEYALLGAKDFFLDEVEDGGGARENGSGGDDDVGVQVRALVDAAVSADESVVFDDDGEGADGFEDAADLRAGGDVAMRADLGATPDESVGIDHGVVVDPSADVDVGWGHDRHARSEVGAAAHGRAAGDDSDFAFDEVLQVGHEVVFVTKLERRVLIFDEMSQFEPEEDGLFDACIALVDAVSIGSGGAHLPRFDQGEEFSKGVMGGGEGDRSVEVVRGEGVV